jgi:hypothetical protein
MKYWTFETLKWKKVIENLKCAKYGKTVGKSI